MSKHKYSKEQIVKQIFKLFLVIIGTIVIAFGNTAFLSPLDINSGGLNGIAIIIRTFVSEDLKVFVYNLFIDIATVVLWLIGLLFVGKEFAMKTLVSSIVFPLAVALFTTVPGVSNGVQEIGNIVKGTSQAGNFLLGALFGGMCVGIGVGFTFLGGGSSGGVDVITILAEKYLNIKESVGSFLVDGLIIACGLIIMCPLDPSKYLIPCLCGIFSAAMSSLFIELIYIRAQCSYQVDVISDKWEEISQFAQNELGRGATIIHANGGYKNENRIILRVVFDFSQYIKLKKFILTIDPKAFITFTRTNAVYGEGFKIERKREKKKKDGN